MNVALLAQVDSGYKFEPETLKWMSTMRANSATASGNTIIAVDSLIKKSRNHGWRSSIKHMNLMCGNSITSARCPIICDVGNSIWTNGGTTLSTYSEILGVTSNGAGYYLTGVIANSIASNGHGLVGAYTTKVTNGQGHALTGVKQVAPSDHRCGFTTNTAALDGLFGTASTVVADTSLRTGLGIVDRSADNRIDYYYNGSSTANSTSAITPLSTTIEYYVFCRNVDSVASDFLTNNNFQISTVLYGLTMSSSLHSSMATDIAAFNAKIGRT